MENPHQIREDARKLLMEDKAFQKIPEETKIRIEKSIYSASINEANKWGTIPNWSNSLFEDIYISNMRRILVNLDKNSHVQNKWLIDHLSEIKVKELGSLTSEELFPERWEEFNKIKEQQESVKVERSNMDDNLIICGKCKSKDVMLNMAQTRSADEGMTQIFTCQACGHRWKR